MANSMISIIPIQPLYSKVLVFFFFLFVCTASQAQDKNVADTIAFILHNKKDHIQQCDALYTLGTYYWNIGQPENALVVMNQSKEVAEKNKNSPSQRCI